MSRLTILKEVGVNKHRKTLVLCRCECGKEKVILQSSINSGRVKSCGCLRKEVAKRQIAAVNENQIGEGNPSWKGGKFKRKGYVFVYCPSHPRARKSHVQEHILVMEKIIGRYLLPLETVHHKNGVKDDNKPDNLELWSRSHPYGQRVEDLVKYAREILALYGGA